jgi:hypothetical protein
MDLVLNHHIIEREKRILQMMADLEEMACQEVEAKAETRQDELKEDMKGN